ncbi:hypothetical protein H310_07214 [Aphanomyces invadans]|uniref:RRM domain-containing protein n=1 Tax=Aphanomyces invadans TaxID=157072 RepID=A0A024U2H5_9STRA|nr:hypothetical protein H310_07214 [Aphanomyces invadans]ETW00646.1 hypothetical protein H310_07214 [Aphanomyces invadans]RHY31296.1 hypothetical protein DYB32_003630 [Aphanomyces invadans]|eukprot:XP_008870781.1 hypothetical protein H310_07214 [Aphanomyces invadans]
MARKVDDKAKTPVEEVAENVVEQDHEDQEESAEEGVADNGGGVDEAENDDQGGDDGKTDDREGNGNDELPDLLVPKKRKKKDESEKKGVVYMSRVPPFMKPDHVRRLLSEYGPIGRIYLVEEDKTARKRRLKNGGNRQVNFTEGWIEFKRKKDAKSVAKALNTTLIGGKKRSKYHDDIWNLKYLKGFQWTHLTEKVAYENRVRDQKLRLEVAQAAKENAAFLERVDQAKKLEKMVERKHALHPETADVPENIRRTFRQNEAVDKTAHGSLDDSAAASMLGKVFKKRKVQDS